MQQITEIITNGAISILVILAGVSQGIPRQKRWRKDYQDC
ncbi:phage holin%2C LL-H family [Streptococcus pneumoniae]|nr:phage holin%2C LL-H family [Streptococcus pneumoniae]CKB32055.1 phage holin%2C LL-H family [Streptococcus pneumoniae]